MSLDASTLRRIAALNLSTEAFQEVLSIIADMQADEEERRERQRERKAKSRALSRDKDVTVTGLSRDEAPPSPSSFSPTPPHITTPTPLSSLRSESIKSDWPKDAFEQFWQAYPRKVGRKAAQRRFDLVKRAGETPFAALLAAVGRIEASDPKFIPHPTTWLNEGRYLDGEVATTGPPGIGAMPPGMTPERLEWIREQQRKQANGGRNSTLF